MSNLSLPVRRFRLLSTRLPPKGLCTWLTKLSEQSFERPSTERLTLTIRFTCPLCSEEHGLSFLSYLSTRLRTYRPSTMQCCESLLHRELFALVIPSSPSTVSV